MSFRGGHGTGTEEEGVKKGVKKGLSEKGMDAAERWGPRQEATNLVIGEPTGPRGLQVRGVIE